MVIPSPTRVQIPMRDGVNLVGDLYLPRPGVFPTLLCKTPYDRTRPAVYPDIAQFLDHDYAVLIASFRGRYGSEGHADEWETEGWGKHPDGYDTIEWAAAQEWSTGDIGIYGISADGQWQLTTAATKPPHLKAACASYAAHGRAGLMEGGVYTSVGPRWHASTGMFSIDLTTRQLWEDWLVQWKETETPLLLSFLHRGLLQVFQHEAYDDYWRGFDPNERYEDFEIPVLYECGWFDRYTGSQFCHFQGVRSRSTSEHARDGQRIVVGPWLHGGNLAPQNDHVAYPDEARSDRSKMMVRWFDRWLKGIDNGVDRDPKLRLYMTGSNRWIELNEWPAPNTTARTFWLADSERQQAESLNSGALLDTEPKGEQREDSFVHDPYDPVRTIGGHGGVTWMWPPGALDQRPAEARSLTFTSAPIDRELEVVGEPAVALTVSTSAEDTDLIVTLTDVHPDGYSELVRQGALRLRYRNGPEQADPVEPGALYSVEVRMTPVAHSFRAGHRIRIAVASSSFPNFLPNAGTAHPAYLQAKGVVATNVVFHDAERPSTLILPIRTS
jgi:putative CocE/NonD family hydrolase